MRTGSRNITANCSSFTANTIVKRARGYHVVSEKNGKNLGGPYKSRGEAEKRLAQVEYFKHTENAAAREEMRNGAHVITNPTLDQFNGFMDHEARSLGSKWEGVHGHRARFIVDGDNKKVHFVHAAKAVHDDIVDHFGLEKEGAWYTGFMKRGGLDQGHQPRRIAALGINVLRAEPQPLDEWEQDGPRTGDNPEIALPSGWEDKRGGKGRQRPGKRLSSRYQQPFGDQDVGQGLGDREEKNYGPLEF